MSTSLPASGKSMDQNRALGIGEDQLQKTERFLGLRDTQDSAPSWDVVFVSIDLEISRSETGKPGPPLVREIGLAILDSRLIISRRQLPAHSIVTHQFSTSHASKDFIGCDITDFRECMFAETFFIKQVDIAAKVKRCFSIRDDKIHSSYVLRNVVLVAHSPARDLQMLQRLGIDVYKIPSIVSVVDTHTMARHLLGLESPFIKATSTAPLTRFRLCDVLTALDCPFEMSELHNAGNDATYTLHALLKLVTESSRTRDLSPAEREHLGRLRTLTSRELHECDRWKPIRRALGFHAPVAQLKELL